MVAGLHALMVEPDVALAGRMRTALETCGFTVEILTDSGAAALKLSTATPELLLLDLDPSLTDSLCKQMKKRHKQTHVLAFTANGDGEGVLKRWFGAKPDVLLRKP